MITGGLSQFSGKRVLLLQGPVGPFFYNLAQDLRDMGAEVLKINFNGGDWLYYPSNAVNFRGRMEEWEGFLDNFLQKQAIDAILLFGDCRTIHVTACAVAARHNIKTGVFEEGYIRPDYITFEYAGVNARSSIPRDPAFYKTHVPASVIRPEQVQKAFRAAGWQAVYYYTAATFLKPFFLHYKHHRPLHILEGLLWVRSFYRKKYYAFTEKFWDEKLAGRFRKKFFLVPLQVAHDAQVRNHSHYADIVSFILHTVESFAKNAPADTLLVIKHHPMDRAYNDYGRLIRSLAAQHGLEGRLVYLHDQHLPSLLDAARGVIVINSTVGLSALHHKTPTKVCGKAIYDMEGLTYQGSVDDFWRAAPRESVDAGLYNRFLNYIIQNTQLNGSFYRKLGPSGTKCGVIWEEKISVEEQVQKRSLNGAILLKGSKTAAAA
ncbi:MAG: capsular biosynthesis protein [Micavibrio sp.]